MTGVSEHSSGLSVLNLMLKKWPTFRRESCHFKTDLKLLLGNCVGFEVPLIVPLHPPLLNFVAAFVCVKVRLVTTDSFVSLRCFLHRSDIFCWYGSTSPVQGTERRTAWKLYSSRHFCQVPCRRCTFSACVLSLLPSLWRPWRGHTKPQHLAASEEQMRKLPLSTSFSYVPWTCMLFDWERRRKRKRKKCCCSS